MEFLDMLRSTIHALKQYFATKQELSKKQDKITDEEMTTKMEITSLEVKYNNH